jgi:hypothetical protein
MDSEDYVFLALTDSGVLDRLYKIEEELQDQRDLSLQLEAQIEILQREVKDLQEKLANGQGINPEEQEPLKLKTMTEFRAYYLFEYLRNKSPRFKTQDIFLTSKEINDFLQDIIQEEYRIPKMGNDRQKKSEVIKKIIDMYPDDVFVNARRKKSDSKTLRLRKKM